MHILPIDYENDDLMTIKDFEDSVLQGAFIDYDGSGYYSNGLVYDRDEPAIPSIVYKHGTENKYIKNGYSIATHVVWFNK